MLERLYKLILIISVCFMGVSYGSPHMRSEIAPKRLDNLIYQLTKDVLPQHYTLKISPEINENTFTGYVKILIRVTTPIINITLHQLNLNIIKRKIYLTDGDGSIIRIKDARVSGTKEQEFYTITLKNRLPVNTYNLVIPEFHGVLNNPGKGFQRVRYIDENDNEKNFAMTEFEATYARSAFPCFDEPSFRAKFKIYIIRPPNYHSLANTKLIKSTKLVNSDLYEDEFETTPLMPTYLVAFIISEMKLSPEPLNNFYRILARPLAIELGYEKYALNLGKIVLPTLETYFKVNYSLNKMDQAAIPSSFYEVGAMENWGLITFVELSLLLTPRTSTKQKLEIDISIAHEFTHQWFGDLVTIKWWRYLWLKEGFASFFQSRIIDMIKPEWKLMEQFIVVTKHDCLETDSTPYTRAMNQDVGSPAEILNIFDSISYGKAACIIHMLETIMTSAVFQNGITNYLKDRSFQSASPIDLYRNFQKAMTHSEKKLPKNLSIKKIMTTWVSQEGCPLIYVERNYGISQEVVNLTQSRYIDDKTVRSKAKPWYIPINYATQSHPNFKDTQFNDWLLKSNARITIKNLHRTEWLILNKQEAYYYRVNYDGRNWKLIIKALLKNYENIHILNRVQLIDDSFHLAKTDRLDFEIFLKITTYLYDEDNYITHYAFLNAAKYVMVNILAGADVEPSYQAHIIRILKSAYKRLGHNDSSKDTPIDKLHRSLVLEWMCRLNYAQCREKSREMFNLWRYQNVQLPVDLQKPILCNAIRNENQSDWEYLFKMYPSFKNDENLKQHAFQSLGCTRDVSSLMRLLDGSLKASTGSNYDFSKVVKLLSNEGLGGLEVVLNYLRADFKPLLSTFGNKYISKILTTIASKLTTKKQIEKLHEIVNSHTSEKHVHRLDFKGIRFRVSANQKRVHQISKFFYGVRSNGNLSLTIPNTCYFILYSLLITILLLQNNVVKEYFELVL